MIVLDASAALELVLGTPTGVRVAARVAPEAESLHAPHLLDVEVLQVLRRHTLSGQLRAERAAEALADFLDLDVERHAHDLLASRIWALRANATAYDAAYLALAELLGAPLLTCDARLAGVPGVAARVELV